MSSVKPIILFSHQCALNYLDENAISTKLFSLTGFELEFELNLIFFPLVKCKINIKL